jgi:hypothetical protein
MYKIGQVSKLSAWLIFFFIHTTKGIPADELFLCLFLKNSEWTLGVQQVRGRMVLIARHLRERSLQVEHQRLPGQGVRLDVKVSQSPFLRPLIMWNYFMEHRLLFLPGEGVRLDVKVGQSQFLKESQKLVMKILPSLCEWVSHPVRWGNWLSLQVQVTKFKQSERLSMPQLVHWCLYRCKSSRAQYNKTLNLHDELIFGISKMFVLGMFFTWWTSPSEVVVAYSKTASLE